MRTGQSLNFEERVLAQSELARFPTLGTSVPNRIPDSRCAQGQVKQFGIRSGLLTSLYDLYVTEEFGGAAYTEPCLSVATFIAASGVGVVDRRDAGVQDIRIPYSSGYTYVSFIRARTFGRYEFPVGSRFLGVEVRASLDYLERLNALECLRSVSTDHPLHLLSTDTLWMGRLSLNPATRATALRLLEAGLQHADDLSVEACSLDILTAAIGIMRAPSAARPSRPDRDARKLMAAKSLMVSDVARSWTISALARQVGLSEKRLKTGFRVSFGVPVHAFLQRSRLEAAKAMLEQHDGSITDIALAVGYANPSHFAKLFRRAFGMRPSAYVSRR